MDSPKNSGYLYLHIFSMVFIAIMLCDSVLTYKYVRMPFGYAEACIFVIPLWFIVGDIITEVYGQALSKKILWTGLVIEIIFSFYTYFLVHLPSPVFWKNEPAYDLILGHLPRVVFSSAIAVLISGYINIYCISKWKVMLRGKYFWIRSIGASWISEGVYSFIAVYFITFRILPFHAIMIAIFWSYLSKIILTIVLATPGAVIANVVKARENIPPPPSFDPFKTYH